ncbi:MAG: 1-(5-phosphoribosyl)-5-[(5-phosphoribosylamino)methylideneamino]imidazole-4-carboxamide isomerase [Coriobacteriales bacterium]|jgi:phosphoribosylformimino-5-aminoimidazole carboxamide ribotide isomerase|nr:1-(5-phosphoribosyl)-5-[(5-phosphoribosylamino)methylideneamino]imidazole-4-carboxamide isomerase [Coriobacteriales bacterium]
MYLLPAIDLLGGKAVRLAKGDYNAVTVYNDDPVEQAELWALGGARWIHVVDLDGARTGQPHNAALIERIIAAAGVKVEVGGGVRSLATIERLVKAGASRVVLGTKLVSDPTFAQEAVAQFGDIICAGVDARDGEVAIEGWRAGAGVPATELIAQLAGWGIEHLVYTDIARDGMQTGIDAAAYERVSAYAGFPVTASGGISTLDDLRALAAQGPLVIEGAIAGRALYEGSFRIEDAIAVLEGRTVC